MKKCTYTCKKYVLILISLGLVITGMPQPGRGGVFLAPPGVQGFMKSLNDEQFVQRTIEEKIDAIVEYYKEYGEYEGAATGWGTFVRTPSIRSVELLKKIGLRSGMTVFDAGSGDGFVLALAAACGANVIGYEANKDLYEKSKEHIGRLTYKGIIDRNKISLHNMDYRYANKSDIAKSDFIYMFWTVPGGSDPILYFDPFEDNLLSHMKPHAKIFVYGGVPGMFPHLLRYDQYIKNFELFTKPKNVLKDERGKGFLGMHLSDLKNLSSKVRHFLRNVWDIRAKQKPSLLSGNLV